jgi:hypothetical protein
MKLVKNGLHVLILTLFTILVGACSEKKVPLSKEYKILFLHHSTGAVIYKGEGSSINILGKHFSEHFDVADWFEKFNKGKDTAYELTEQYFPKEKPYGWVNNPYDYYNIWVKHAGQQPFMEEPTLEMLTKEYKMIIFKHCFPVSDIEEDQNNPNIDSDERRTENYKLQYQALKQKMLEFPQTKFMVWTGAALLESETTPEKAERARKFFDWVRNEWDTPGDNMYLWDFDALETEEGLYLKAENAAAAGDSHPGKDFAKKTAPLLCQRIIDVMQNNGAKTTLIGVFK